MDEAKLTIITFTYTNHKGITEIRRVRPLRVWFGASDYHPEPCWHMDAHCLDRNDTRSFVLAGMVNIKEGPRA